jgi:radical SAM superfamily enzyme YgiQ (UPF0313 family)
MPPQHPLGARARVLLTSVFGPYGQDDEFGSRAINPMELYHNQVTRAQDVFSLRMFHRSWGLMLIQANLDAPTTLLDFPTRERFIEELRRERYDIVGISAISPNIGKVAEMCRLIRRHLPDATIVVGGHAANHPRLREKVDADHVVRGEGVGWFRRFLGLDANHAIRHPLIESAVGARTMGVSLSQKPGDTAATLIPSVGCPMGCSFCSTSAMFGGKGRFVSFFETGDELFEVMCGIEAKMGVRSFFVMDENFLLHRRRALRLLELLREHGKSWSFYVFSSANALRLYSTEELVALGISWLWIGLEGENSEYVKLARTDTHALVRELQSHGIRVLGSSIVGLLEHTPDNIDRVIEHAVRYDTDFHQFMLYTPVPGTPLHEEHAAGGSLLSEAECPDADAHGQLRFNFRHPTIRDGQETEFLTRAFERDFRANGPSVLRIARTLLEGWRRYKDHPDARVRERYRFECRDLPTAYAGSLWAAERWFGGDEPLRERLRRVRGAIVREFGLTARLMGPIAGSFILAAMYRERRRLRRGEPNEPPTFYEVNQAAAAEVPGVAACAWVGAAPAEVPSPAG